MCLLCVEQRAARPLDTRALSRILLLGLPLLAACDKGSEPKDTQDTSPTIEAVCEDPVEVECLDELILNLGLQDGEEVSAGEVVSTASGGEFTLQIDATGGGISQAPSAPWVYVRFEDDGAVKVELGDEEALESMDWHLAAKRYLLRLNGGSSGPSCVGAIPLLETAYEDTTALDADAEFLVDDFFTSDCTLINDSSGLEGSPQLALSSWWSYPGCVATTAVPFVVRLDDGRQLKLVVDSYYASGQENCNETGAMGSGSANFTMRWSWL